MKSLLKEIFCVYRDKYIADCKKRGWKENLFLLPVTLAGVVLVVLLMQLALQSFK